MKFKSEEEISESVNEQCENCPICDTLNIIDKQIDIILSMISSIRTSLDTIRKMHEKHDSE